MPITRITTAVYRFPTPEPEADGTLQWNATTAVTVTLQAGGKVGLGWTYSAGAAADVIHDVLATAVEGRSAFDIPAGWAAMHRAGRNLGTKGLVMQALSAVDIAWWDLKARLLDVSLADLFGRCRRGDPRLWLRRIHHADRVRTGQAGRLVALRGLHGNEDQDWRGVRRQYRTVTSNECDSSPSSRAMMSS